MTPALKTSKKSAAASKFSELLTTLAFTQRGSVFTKTVNGSLLKVDMAKELIQYPESDGLIVNDRTTCNFAQDENFVVFECVHRLLEKGYKAESLELEPRWKLGRGASGGKADILVKTRQGRPLLIIECKNSGTAFTRAWNDTRQDGGQLFSYGHQISEVQFLCLYSSSCVGGEVKYESLIVAHTDNHDYLALNPNLASFQSATDVKSRFGVWRDTYKLAYTPVGVFEETIPAYQIGKAKYTISDLSPVGEAEEKSLRHAFLSILRQHNISARENAFDKLINLLLCKLVDELDNPEDLKFFWKGIAYETHFDLLDRLQQLYQAGMDKFLGEDITYINQDDISNAMRFVRQQPDATQNAVWQLFIKQKFFTNNDFSLIDVHNEKLFYENAEVLLKLIQMWQSVKLTGNKGQVLGDLFEHFLDQGIKQSEGQFFTPKPICRFIINSLPLPELLERVPVPKAIDYACGAGHFLNELADQLIEISASAAEQLAVEEGISTGADEASSLAEHNAQIQKSIFGIEKEYRLSKVAKVAAFMHGHRDVNISYADALIHDHTTYPGIKNDSFDVLVANPPYSVKGFLETLPEDDRNRYEVAKSVERLDTFGSIEVLFIERAAQLMRAGAVAGIILPSGVLNNEGVYTKARELLLRSFEIVSIVELGNRTFGKTGTTTVTLFLRRRATTPDDHRHFEERVRDWFQTADSSEPSSSDTPYDDREFLDRYVSHVGYDPEEYRLLLTGTISESLASDPVFKAYRKAYDGLASTKAARKSAKFANLSEEERAAEIAAGFYKFVSSIESRKMLYFRLASSQQSDVLVIRAPSGTAEQKTFLGYTWSDSKESGGIHIQRGEDLSHTTPLYDEKDRDNPDKLSRYIAESFNGQFMGLPSSLEKYGFAAPLSDLIGFDRADLDLRIELSKPTTAVRDMYRWPVVPLDEEATIAKGTSITEEKAIPGKVKVVAGGKTSNYTHNVSNRPAGVITVSASGASAGFVNYWAEPIFASDCTTIVGPTTNDTKYLYYVLKERQRDLFRLARGSAQPHVYPRHLEAVLVPDADAGVRTELVKGCTAIDSKLKKAWVEIETLHGSLQAAIDGVAASASDFRTIQSLSQSGAQYGLNTSMDEPGAQPAGTRIFRMNELIEGRLVDNGRMKTVNLPAEEIARYRLAKGDILFNRTNSLEHVGKSALFDLDGEFVFASYLVRIVPDRSVVDPKFMALMMAGTKFRATAKSVATPSINQANINASKMGQLSIPYIDEPAQAVFLKEVAVTQQRIIDLRLTCQQLEVDKHELIEGLLGAAPERPSTLEDDMELG